MAKIGIFKKIAALATAIAIVLCFAVSAGAADITVTTKTSYFEGNKGDISVNVTITGDDIEGTNVSYYASKDNVPVYIDQFDDFNGNETFSYVTSDANLNSEVKVSYTGAEERDVYSGNVEGKKVTWKNSAGDVVAYEYIPTNAPVATVTFKTDATKVVGTFSADYADIVNAEITKEGLSVILSEINAEAEEVVLTIDTETEAVVELIDAAFVVSNGHDDIETDFFVTVKGDRKLTAIGKVKGDPAEFGIIVTTDSENYDDDEDKYKAVASTSNVSNKNDNGYYAIQLIDTVAENGDLLDADSYYVAAYADVDVTDFTSVELKDLN